MCATFYSRSTDSRCADDDNNNMSLIPIANKVDGSKVCVYKGLNGQPVLVSKGSLGRNVPVDLATRHLNDAPIGRLLDGVATLEIEVVNPDEDPKVEVRPEEGLYLLQVCTAELCMLGADDLNAWAEAHHALLTECGISYTPVEWMTVQEVTSRLAALDGVDTVDAVKEGFVAKLASTMPHPAKDLALKLGGYGALKAALDEAVEAKMVARKCDGNRTLYIYTELYNATPKDKWDPVVAAIGRGSVFETDASGVVHLVCCPMPKFFRAATPEDACVQKTEQHKLKSLVYLQLAKLPPPTRAWLAKTVSAAVSMRTVFDAIDAAPFLLDGATRVNALLSDMLEAAKAVEADARALVAAHEGNRKAIGQARVAPLVKSVAFAVVAAKEEVLLMALKGVAKAGR